MVVIPAKAGIQSFKLVNNSLDTGSCRRTGETTFYEIINFKIFKTVLVIRNSVIWICFEIRYSDFGFKFGLGSWIKI